MKAGTSKERFERLLADNGLVLASLTPRMGLDLMFKLYEEHPHLGPLLCSFGSVTRHGEDECGISIGLWHKNSTEQPVLNPDDLEILFKVGSWELAIEIPCWMKWADNTEHQMEFRAELETMAAWERWGNGPVSSVALVHKERVAYYDLFDCWGVRDPARPVVSMTEDEWLRSDDAPLMLRWFRQEWVGDETALDRLLHRYLLACCRRIWKLLPCEGTRSGVEIAERFLDGMATREELWKADWLAEGEALRFHFEPESEEVLRWADEVSQIPKDELNAMLCSPGPEDDLSPRALLGHAAYFADSTMVYFGIKPKESIERYRLFLSAPLLREIVGNPFAETPGRRC
ncbi:hypothetical protein TA3x_003369 [Tundrisphaera sp. TA3]|uniref:hypothetical protein n=1 Tax=Tundrisphaera sp. TA3 TaxID=3435775 RepID=UPI003EBFBDE1